MTTAGVWDAVVGQEAAVGRLTEAARDPVHAYLLVGPQGAGAGALALGFAALVLSLDLTGPAAERARRLALASKHPDLVTVVAEGQTVRRPEAEAIIRAGLRTPTEGRRKVILVPGVDAIEEAAVGALLKVVEEPPASTVFVFLAAQVPPELVTVASRCVVIDVAPLPTALVRAALVRAGADPERAAAAAEASGGDLDRALLLVEDERLASRQRLWWDLPARLDGSGAAVVAAVRELRAAMDDAQQPLQDRQVRELAELEARVQRLGERGSGRADLVARHRRELRRLRDDELRFGLATVARRYHAELVQRPDDDAERAIAAVHAAADAMIRNPNEALLLQALALQLPPR